MKLKKDKDGAKELRTNLNKVKNINNLDTPMKIYDYQNRVYMIQRRINERVKEEQKNIEKYLTKINTTFHSLTSRNFYRDYKKFSDKYFKTTNLVDAIADKYQDKGYNINNLNLHFYQVNPLLDSNPNKLFISYLFNGKDEKIDCDKLFTSNKGIKYMKKLKNFISPEKNEEEKEVKHLKSKKNKAKHKKFKLLKNKERKSKNSTASRLAPILTISNNNNINREKKDKYSSSKSINIFQYKGKFNERYNNNNYSLFNKNSKKEINRSKSINSTTPTIKYERKNNKHDSHKINLKKKNGLYLNIQRDPNKRLSSNQLTLISSKINFRNNNFFSKDKPHLNLNTEKIIDNQSEEYILDTPENKNKNKIFNRVREKSNSITKPFSSTNNEENSLNPNLHSSKTKNSLKSFRINEFSANSKKYKNSISSKKMIVITEYNNKNLLNTKNFIYSRTIRNEGKEKNIISDIIKDATISSNEKKEGDINQIYKQLKAGKYENIENKMKNYLSNVKKLNKNEIDFLMKKYEYKNLRSNFNELKKYISEKKLSKKLERIYINNHDYNRIEPLLKLLSKRDKEICGFQSKISKIYNKS